MSRCFRCFVLAGLVVGVFSLNVLTAQAQEATVPGVIQFSGVLKNSVGRVLTGVQGVQFALYSDQEGGAPLWIESQNVAADAEGRFSVLLGSATAGGLPVELFASGASRWLGVQPQVSGETEQPRVLLVSVPYALKAADAETVGGLPASAFVLAPDAVTERVKDSGGLAAVSDGVITAQANSGSAGFIGKFFNATDLDNSALFQSGSSIGLGTTTPESALHIQGASTDGITVTNGLSTGVGFLRFKRADGGIAGEIRSLIGTQTLVINSNGAERMRIAPSGFVGIGTTSPIAQLHVSSPGSTRMMFQGNAGTNGVIGLDMDSTARRWTLGAQGTNENGAFILFDFTAGQRRMTVDSTGQFGIGTITPSAKLDVNGTVKATAFEGGSMNITGTGGGIVVQDNATSPNIVGGFSGNSVSGGVVGATISGGGQNGQTNRVTDDGGVVGGGINNQAGDGAGTTSDKAFATVGGGQSNTASGRWATVAGGATNNAIADRATVGGGDQNTASGGSATVPGGLLNTAAGSFSFAAGRRAKANHDGAFVWGDSTDADFASTGTNQFLIRAAGGVGIGIDAPAEALDVMGTVKASGKFALPNTVDAGTGVLTLGGVPFFHNFTPGNVNFPFSNTFVGTSAGNFTMNGADSRQGGYNTGLGFQTLSAVTTGSANTASGTNALQNNTTGTDNTAAGAWALNANTTGGNNTATGAWALQFNTASNNTATGGLALQFNTIGTNNTASGALALYQNTEGNDNSAVGNLALRDNTTGNNNNAFGSKALLTNTTGVDNIAMGTATLSNNTTGSFNTAVGRRALNANTTATNNTAVGRQAMRFNTIGNNNTAVGAEALNANTTGVDNTAVGELAGVTSVAANSNLTGTFNTFVGSNSGPGVDGTTTPLTNATAIGANAVVSQDNSLVLGSINGVNGATSDVNVGIGTTGPTQKLEVNGGARLNTVDAQPACDATVRGTFWVTQGGAGVKDSVEVCAKDAGDAYAWRTLY